MDKPLTEDELKETKEKTINDLEYNSLLGISFLREASKEDAELLDIINQIEAEWMATIQCFCTFGNRYTSLRYKTNDQLKAILELARSNLKKAKIVTREC